MSIRDLAAAMRATDDAFEALRIGEAVRQLSRVTADAYTRRSVGGIMASDTASSGQPESSVTYATFSNGTNGTTITVELPPEQPPMLSIPIPGPARVIDYSPQLTMTEATGRAILAQLMVLQEQMADLAAVVQLLVASGQARGVVATQGQ